MNEFPSNANSDLNGVTKEHFPFWLCCVSGVTKLQVLLTFLGKNSYWGPALLEGNSGGKGKVFFMALSERLFFLSLQSVLKLYFYFFSSLPIWPLNEMIQPWAFLAPLSSETCKIPAGSRCYNA